MSTMEADIALSAESRRLLSLVQKCGPITKAELAKSCGYQMSSLNRYLEPLLAEGFVETTGTAASGGGRRPLLFDVCGDCRYVLGVNIATVYIEVLVINLKMRVVSQERFDLPSGTLPEEALERVRDSIARQVAHLDIPRRKILGVGLSSIGPFDRERGVILSPIVLHMDPAWIGYPIRASLEKLCGMRVAVDIGANNAVLAEYLFGHGRGAGKLLCVRCGMSIKTSYIVSGAIVRTSNNAEDAFGHMSVDIDGLPCVCGNYGCIECYSSIPALVALFAAERKKGRTTLVSNPLDETGFLDVLAAADAGDALAREVVMRAATVLGAGLANYLNLLNPDVVTLDGLIIRNSMFYYETAVDVAIRKGSLLNKGIGTRFVRFSHFDDPSTFGAAVLAMETFLFQQDNLIG